MASGHFFDVDLEMAKFERLNTMQALLAPIASGPRTPLPEGLSGVRRPLHHQFIYWDAPLMPRMFLATMMQ